MDSEEWYINYNETTDALSHFSRSIFFCPCPKQADPNSLSYRLRVISYEKHYKWANKHNLSIILTRYHWWSCLQNIAIEMQFKILHNKCANICHLYMLCEIKRGRKRKKILSWSFSHTFGANLSCISEALCAMLTLLFPKNKKKFLVPEIFSHLFTIIKLNNITKPSPFVPCR